MSKKIYNQNLLKNLIPVKELYFLFFLLSQIFSYCQGLSMPKNIHSPNAASLGKYGDIPISYYTGTPTISIPLYSLNISDIPLNINLSYNATGVRVNDMPVWVGQNWSLNAGGVITRTIKAIADEINTKEAPEYYYNGWYTYGYFASEARKYLNADGWDKQDYIFNDEKLETGNYNEGISREFEPDIFTFNFMGHNGKINVSSKSNLKVTIDLENLKYPLGMCRVPFGTDLNGTKVGGENCKGGHQSIAR